MDFFRGDDWTKGQERAARLERDKKKLTLGERYFKCGEPPKWLKKGFMISQ